MCWNKSSIIYAALLSTVFLAGCATNTFKVTSEPPQAEVFILNPKNNEKKSIGKTPLDLPLEDVRTAIGEELTTGEFYTVLIEKPGYGVERYSLPVSGFGTLVTNLDVKMKQGAADKELRLAQEILDRLFLAQKFANMQQFERAHIELDKVLTPFPEFARALSMRASIYFAQKNFNESLKWYEAAVKADPQADEAVKMIVRVKDILGGKSVAASGAAQRSTASTPPAKTEGKK